jgi:beta-galactosidase
MKSDFAARLEPLENRRFLSAPPASLGGVERSSIELTSGWKFIRQNVKNAQVVGFNDSAWQSVSVPHTWNAADGANGGNDYSRGSSWYRRPLAIPSDWSGRRIYLKIDAASTSADVFVNGTLVQGHLGGYSAFTFDITAVTTAGTNNTLAVKVNNEYDERIAGYRGDWTIFGGITRGVSVFSTETVHVTPLDLGSPGVKLLQRNVSNSSATLDVVAQVRNTTPRTANFTVRTSLVDANNNVVRQVSSDHSVVARKTATVNQTMTVNNPRLWDGIADPYRYTAFVQVFNNGRVVDTIDQPVGFRYFTLSASGFTLNGRSLFLKGANLHQDRAGKGSAVSDADREADLLALKEMGANAVRLVHWQHDPYTYEVADREGLIVWTEIPLWARIAETGDFFKNSRQQISELIRQNINHPSILFWGLYNELPDEQVHRDLITDLNNRAELEDPTRPTLGASWHDYYAGLNYTTDHTAFNKYFGWYGNYAESNTQRFQRFDDWLQLQQSREPTRSLAMSEYGAGASTDQWAEDPVGPSSDPNQSLFHPENYQSLFHEEYHRIITTQAQPLWGMFVWQFTDSGNDNRNEGSQPGINNKGMISYDRSIKKDAFYFYKAQWSATPTLHLTEKRFTARQAQTVNVKAYSNLGANVELRVNGVSQGTRNDADRILEWTGINLNNGNNTIEIRSTLNGTTYTETATWTYTGASGSAFASSFSEVPIRTTTNKPEEDGSVLGKMSESDIV